jgi:hypothetical protein
MGCLAVLVATCLHVPPQRHHLIAKLRRTGRASLALAGMTQEKKTLLLLHYDLLLLRSFWILVLWRVGVVGIDHLGRRP